MGFWDTVKKAVVTTKCATGWHAGSYTQISGHPQCHLEKTCPDCGKHLTKVVHKYMNWEYKFPNKCDMERACEYCNEREFKVKHEYEQVGKDNECHLLFRCRRCKDEKTGPVKHEYEQVGKDNECHLLFRCRRCKDEKTGSIKHEFEWVGRETDCRIIERCRHCGYQRLGEAQHDWIDDHGQIYCSWCRKVKS